MSNVLISVSEATAGRLILKSQELQVSLPTLLEQLSKSLDGLTQAPLPAPQQAAMPTNTPARGRGGSVKDSPLLPEAVERAKRIPAGQHFTLDTLFGDEWEALPQPRVFGRLFKDLVEEAGVAKHVGDDKDVGMAKYVRL